MKRLFFIVTLLLTPLSQAQPATPALAVEGDNPALRLTVFALGEEVSEGDPRVMRTQTWLARAARATGEEERAIAAASTRAASHFFDLTRVRVSPLEPLEALARVARPGQPMSDVLMHYIEARRAAADKSHEAALRALGAGP